MNGGVENGGNKTMSSLRIRSLKMGSCNRPVSKHVKFWLQLITVGVVIYTQKERQGDNTNKDTHRPKQLQTISAPPYSLFGRIPSFTSPTLFFSQNSKPTSANLSSPSKSLTDVLFGLTRRLPPCPLPSLNIPLAKGLSMSSHFSPRLLPFRLHSLERCSLLCLPFDSHHQHPSEYIHFYMSSTEGPSKQRPHSSW